MSISRRAFLSLALGIGGAALSDVRRALAAPGVGPSSTASSGRAAAGPSAARSTQQIAVGGVTRTYIRYEPEGLDAATSVPLVMVLHARGGSGAVAERSYGMSQLAEQHGFVVVYPDALGEPRAWNPGQAPDRPDDVELIRALVAQETSARALDAGRIFVCGHSSGAAMTYRLAGEASDLFAAVGVVAGPAGFRMPDGTVVTVPKPDHPISVIHIHGTEDSQIPYRGGLEPGGVDLLSAAESVAFWVEQDGCDPTPAVETVGAARRETYSGGRDGTEVELWTIEGGGHVWFQPQTPIKPDGATAGISTPELIWAFFAAHPRGAVSRTS